MVNAVSMPPPPADRGGRSRRAMNHGRPWSNGFFANTMQALIRFLRGRVGSHNEALEVAQEAYVRLLSLDQPGAVSYLRAFLFKTAANIAIDRRRRHQTFDKVAGGQLFTELTENRTPERQLSGEQALRSLGSSDREPCRRSAAQSFVLNQIHGLDAATIANAARHHRQHGTQVRRQGFAPLPRAHGS